MNKSEKQKIVIFARDGFRRFYAENHHFLEEQDYLPGKKMYRNMTALNKMMYCYLEAEEAGRDYIDKAEVKRIRGWRGPSTYSQYERSITNFGLSDTSWSDNDRSALPLSDKGKKLRKKYRDFSNKNPDINLLTYSELPGFAQKFVVDEIKNTTTENMTLWKNVLLSALYLYVVLGYIPRYSTNQEVPLNERNAFINCCNYQYDDGTLKDVSYFTQPAHMLKNLKLLDDNYIMTTAGYKLLLDLAIFKEIDCSIGDYQEIFEEEVDTVEEILDSKIELIQVDAPERKTRKATVRHNGQLSGPRNRNFDEANKKNQKVGALGEQLVFDYERAKLEAAGVEDIDSKLIRTADNKEYGNAYPCDILSVDVETGSTIYIEVKTTCYSAETSFYISEDERDFSEKNASAYRLYRVFDAIRTKEPKFFETAGYVGDNFTLTSDRYIATRDKELE